QLARIERLQGGEQCLVGRPRYPRPLEHLVPCSGKLITIEDIRHISSLETFYYAGVSRISAKAGRAGGGGPASQRSAGSRGQAAARIPTRRSVLRRPCDVPI